MAFTQADLDAVRAALKRAEKTVAFADRSVTYRDLDELQELESRIATALQKERAKQSLGVAKSGF